MTAPCAERVVVTDPPGEATRITLYGPDGPLAFAELDPATAVEKAGDLVEAARVRLGRARLPAEGIPPA